ncbi:MAG: hypothetical protein Fur0022_01970 [Anaerolineales bacterium]
MKKILFVLTIAGLIVLALGVAGFAYAQAQTPPPLPGYGPGMMGTGNGNGRGGMMGQGSGSGHGMMGMGTGMMGEMGALHEYMYPAMAAALGLTPEEFTARHAAGETFWDMAEAQGLTSEEAWPLMQTARAEALQQAVADGVITQAFADQMLTHMEGMHGEGFGPGSGPCHGDD